MTGLFGGAIQSSVPEGFGDVSDIRQVPDHQEVFVSSGSEDSVIFEILERVEGSDQEAVQEHLNEIESLNGAKLQLLKSENCSLPKLTGCPAILTTAVQASHKWGRDEKIVNKNGGETTETAKVFMLILIIRIEKVSCDFLITYSAPCKTSEELEELGLYLSGSVVSRFSQIREWMDSSLNSFKVTDWGLFGE